MPPKQPLRHKNVGGRQRRSKVSDTAAPPQLSETLSRRVKPVAGRSAVFAPKKPAPPLPAVTTIPSLPLSLSQTSFHSVPSLFSSSESSRNPSPSSPPIIPVGTPSSLQLIQLEGMPPQGCLQQESPGHHDGVGIVAQQQKELELMIAELQDRDL